VIIVESSERLREKSDHTLLTNSKAEYPTERPYTPRNLLATIYRHLEIDYTQSFTDYFGRPVPILSDARPIREL
jgi:hypothetical protein